MLTVFFDVAYQSYLPSRGRRATSSRRATRSWRSAGRARRSSGPGLAGVLIGVLRAPLAVVLDALSFLGSALFLFLIRRPEPAPEAHHEEGLPKPGMRREMAEGLRYVLGHAYLKNIAACTATANLFGNVATRCSSSSPSASWA